MKFRSLLLIVALVVVNNKASSQGTQFFRISGPAYTKITAFGLDGTVIWTNALSGTNYTVQTVSSLPGGTNWVDFVQLPVTNFINANRIIDLNPPEGMAFIPAGSFQMGDGLDGESDAPVSTVYVSAFYIDRTDVTYSLWQQVHSWAIAHGYSFDYPGSGKAANHPVQTVNWYDCVKWCNARSEMEGRTPAYYTDGTQTTVYRTGDLDLLNGSVNWGAGYRLPTEAEWEKAARGGLSGKRFPWGNTISWCQANYYGDPEGFAYDFATANDYDPAFSGGDNGDYPYTSPVGSFAANGYGLYDMAGNVYQWCWDWYGTYAGGSNPHGPTSGSYRVIRGGGWAYVAISCGAASRSSDPAFDDGGGGEGNGGFRSVLPSVQ